MFVLSDLVWCQRKGKQYPQLHCLNTVIQLGIYMLEYVTYLRAGDFLLYKDTLGRFMACFKHTYQCARSTPLPNAAVTYIRCPLIDILSIRADQNNCTTTNSLSIYFLMQYVILYFTHARSCICRHNLSRALHAIVWRWACCICPYHHVCFALNYVHYKRWLPVQIRHLPVLHATHLNVYAALLKCNPFSLSSHGTLQLSSISAGSAFLESFVPPINSGFSSTVPIVVIDWSAIVKIRKANYRWYFWWICCWWLCSIQTISVWSNTGI